VLYAQLEAERAAVEPNQQSDFQLFRGGLGIWYVFLKNDEIEVGMTSLIPYKKLGKLSEVKKLETGFGGKGSKNIFLCFHNYKWSRPHEEIPIVITQFNKPVALELMRTLKAKAINAQASAQYIKWMETGDGM